jgi:flagellar motor switch protein FliG
VLTGPEKAVLLLLSLEEAVARPIVAELGETELRKLRTVAATMREVPGNALEETFSAFVAHAKRAVAVPRGGMPYLRRLSAAAIGEERTHAVFEDGTPSALTRLEHAPADALAALLADEPLQVAGAIIARLSAPVAAAVLASMPPERQAAVVAHVGRMTEVPAGVLEEMAAAIVSALPSDEAATIVSVDGVARAAEILNAFGKQASSLVLSTLDNVDAALAQEVREAMFTFDDLVRLDARAMRELVREVPGDRLTIALKGASEEILRAIFAGLSQRAAETVRDDIETLGSIRRADIEKARAEIVQAALRLEADGKISLRSDEDA